MLSLQTFETIENLSDNGEKLGGQLVEASVVIGVGLLFWLVARFIIGRITERVKNGYGVLKKPLFRWAKPVMRPFEAARRVQRAETVGSLLRSVVSVVVSAIVIISTMEIFGLPIAPLLASVGIAGVAIGFGAQQLIRDFLSGIFITIEDQYGIGDIIETSEVVGRVESVGLRVTRVVDEEGVIWYLRNGEILRVGNRSQGNYQPQVDVDTGDQECVSASSEKAAE
jgi:moderate conductance mechanosensitive channel